MEAKKNNSEIIKEEDEEEECEKRRPVKKKSSRAIIIPVVEDDVDLDTVREYINRMKGQDKIEKLSSNKATNGSILADFESEGIGERETAEIVPIHAYEVKEKIMEEYKRRLEISETKCKLAVESIEGVDKFTKDPERGLLLATEASSILYEQFILSCRKLEEEKYKVILEQKIKCMLLIANLHYNQKNYKEAIRELNSVLPIIYTLIDTEGLL